MQLQHMYKPKKIVIHPYNPNWPKLFQAEAELLKQALHDHCIDIQHIGSTSVPGLDAKEDLDILCIVDNLNNSLELTKQGYTFKGELNIPLRYFFSKNSNHSKINLHVVQPKHGFIDLNLCFRDYLRMHDDARQSYGDLKRRLVQDPKSFEKVDGKMPRYTLRKNDFIKKMLELADYQGVNVNFCFHFQEWKEYHRIRTQQIFEPLGIVYDPNHPTLSDDNHFHVVLSQATQIVATAHVEFLSKTEAALRTLATDAEHQGQGHGTKLVQFLERWLQHQGLQVLKLHSNPEAERFYRKLGYGDMVFEDESIHSDPVDLGKRF